MLVAKESRRGQDGRRRGWQGGVPLATRQRPSQSLKFTAAALHLVILTPSCPCWVLERRRECPVGALRAQENYLDSLPRLA